MNATRSQFASSRHTGAFGGLAVGHCNRLVRAGISAVLAEAIPELPVLGEASTTRELIALLDASPPAVVVMQNDLSGSAGAPAVVESGLRRGVRVPVIVIVDPDEDAQPAWGFCQAAVHRDDDGTQLRAAVAVVQAGGTYTDPALRNALSDPVRADEISQRERQILQAIARGDGNKQIAFREEISTETVKSHVTSILRKLDAQTRAEAVAIGFERGLIDSASGAPQVRISSAGNDMYHGEDMLYATYHQAAEAVLRHLHAEFPRDTWVASAKDGEQFVAARSVGNLKTGERFAWTDTLCSRMVGNGGPRSAPDVELIPAYRDAPVIESMRVRSYVGAPVQSSGGEFFGTLCGLHGQVCAEAEDPALELVQTYASLLASFLPAG